MMRLVDDATWAILTLWQEARGENPVGKLAVAEVIRNRTIQHYNSNGTVAGTVLAPFQFSCWNTRDPNRIACANLHDDEPIVIACRAAWEEALAGSNTVLGAVLYCNLQIVSPSWIERARLVAVIGHHSFYVPAG